MSEETDEVKVFRVHEEDESDAPSLADDKKDVALEEEMESKPFFGGKNGAFQPAMPSSPSFGNIFPYPSPSAFYGGVNPLQYALMNQAATALAAQAYIRTLSPCFPGVGGLSGNPLDMYSRLVAAASPTAGPKMGLMGGVPLPASHRQHTLNQMMGAGSSMGGGASTSGPSSSSSAGHHHHHHQPGPKRLKKEKEEHIKKPMNAFMWFMKENRPKIMEEEEWKDKQSAELNKELGSRWQKLGKDDQKKYYEMATRDKEEHLKKYPTWSARENYASNKKKKKKRDRAVASDSNESKKCRARFGMLAQDRWCKHCVRKKKCLYTTGDEEERGSTHSAHQRASDSESDLDDDPTISVRELDASGVKMEVGDVQPAVQQQQPQPPPLLLQQPPPAAAFNYNQIRLL